MLKAQNNESIFKPRIWETTSLTYDKACLYRDLVYSLAIVQSKEEISPSGITGSPAYLSEAEELARIA